MSVEENVVLMRRWFKEVWNEGWVQTIYDLLAENSIAVGQDQPGITIRGPREFEAFYQRIRGAFPDITTTIEDNFGADDKLVVRWSAEMTHKGDQLGIPATNKKVRITGLTIVQIEKGKIIRGWDNWDQLALMQQLGAAAVPDKPAAQSKAAVNHAR
jgi:steroid delta-isomerase-like uncharacterized protein